MPEGVPGGPGPEETGATEPLPNLNEVPAPTPAEEPRRRRWWPFGRREASLQPSEPEPAGPQEELAAREAELEARRRQAERQAGEPIGGLERIKELAESTNPEDLVHLMTIISAEQFREMKLEEKHPGRLGKLGKILAAERDFSVDEDGKIRHNAWRELSRKALTTIFNKKTLLAAGTLGVVGVLTGGLAYPAAAALFGSVGGRGFAEGLEYLYGHERGRRQKIVEAQVADWCRLREMALQATGEDIDPTEIARLYTEIINGFHGQSEQVSAAEERLGQTKAIWNRRRDIFSAIGAGVGAAGGLWLGLKGMTSMGIFDLDRNGFFHAVRNINHVWHFGYGQGEAAAQTTQKIGSALFHQVGPGAETIIVRTAAQIGAVFGGLGLTGAYEKWRGGKPNKMTEILAEEREAKKQEMLGRVPEVPEAPPPPPTPPTPEETLASNQERYRELAGEKSLPVVGQIWIYEDVGGRGHLRIVDIDWQNGKVIVEKLDQAFQSVPVSEQEPGRYQMEIEDLIRKGRELVEDWFLTVQDGDEIEVAAETIVDRSNPKAPKIEAGKYKFKQIAKKPGQAELAQEGKTRPIVDIFDLAIFGVRPIEKGKEEASAHETPSPRQRWRLKQGAGLPAELSELNIANVGINEIRGGNVRFYKLMDRTRRAEGDEGEIQSLSLTDFLRLFEYGEDIGGGGGGEQQQRQRQQRQGGGERQRGRNP